METTGSGLFAFVRVPVGRYTLTVDRSGFKTVKRTEIDLTVGAVVTLDVTLTVGATSESITVSGELPLVETTRSQTSTSVNERAVQELPINGRNFLDFTLLTPGVNRDPRGGDLSFGGQRGTANSLLVDGMDSNNLFFGQSAGRAGSGRNPYSFSQDAVEEFQVSTNGYAAEIGRAGGGVINVVTKAGTNDTHGNAFWYFRDRAMNANTFINKSRSIARQPYHYNQYGGTVGGPIKKDKLFYFLSFDGQRNLNPNPVFFPFAAPTDPLSQQAVQELNKYLVSYTTGYNNDIGLAKVDWNISNADRLSVRYNIHRFRGQNFENSGSQSAQEHTGNSNVSTNHLAVNYSRAIGSSVVFDSRFNYLTRRRTRRGQLLRPGIAGLPERRQLHDLWPQLVLPPLHQLQALPVHQQRQRAARQAHLQDRRRPELRAHRQLLPRQLLRRLPLQQPGGFRRPAARLLHAGLRRRRHRRPVDQAEHQLNSASSRKTRGASPTGSRSTTATATIRRVTPNPRCSTPTRCWPNGACRPTGSTPTPTTTPRASASPTGWTKRASTSCAAATASSMPGRRPS